MPAADAGADEDDPLDAFMAATIMPKVVTREEDLVKAEPVQDTDMADAGGVAAPRVKAEPEEPAPGGQVEAAVKAEPHVKGEPGVVPSGQPAGAGAAGVSRGLAGGVRPAALTSAGEVPCWAGVRGVHRRVCTRAHPCERRRSVCVCVLARGGGAGGCCE